MADPFPRGTVHDAPEDVQAAVQASAELSRRWQGLTPLGRNEFICWVTDAKQPATRQRLLQRMCEELLAGKKRPCCWQGARTGPTRRQGGGSRRF